MGEFDNAVLVEIAAPVALAGNGDSSVGAAVWTGRAGGYLKRERRNVLSGGVQVRVATDSFTILDTELAPVVEVAGPDWEASTVVIEDRRTSPVVTRRFRVNAMEHRAAGTIVDSVRLELEGETAP